MANAVILDNVFKEFGEKNDRIIAVDHLSLNIRKGEIFALVGPDGAGKTTAIRMMCGVLPPSQGSVAILDLPMKSERDAIKKRIGYLSQKFSLYGDLTVDENVDFFAEIHRVKDFKVRKEELLQFTRLEPFRGRLAGRLSGGMKQKLALACTLIHTPDVIFLDEPTTGVDPVSRRDFWKILSTLLKSGITIVVSTPYLDEAERSTRVALLNEGKLLVCDTPEAVKQSFTKDVLELVVEDPRKAIRVLNESQSGINAQLFGDRIHAVIPKEKSVLKKLDGVLKEEGIAVHSKKQISPSLEDVFISRMTS